MKIYKGIISYVGKTISVVKNSSKYLSKRFMITKPFFYKPKRDEVGSVLITDANSPKSDNSSYYIGISSSPPDAIKEGDGVFYIKKNSFIMLTNEGKLINMVKGVNYFGIINIMIKAMEEHLSNVGIGADPKTKAYLIQARRIFNNIVDYEYNKDLEGGNSPQEKPKGGPDTALKPSELKLAFQEILTYITTHQHTYINAGGAPTPTTPLTIPPPPPTSNIQNVINKL